MNDKLTPEELAKVQAKYPVSKAVATLSLGGEVPNASGMIPQPCGCGPVNTGRSVQGIPFNEPRATHLRRARKERGKANLLPNDFRQTALMERTARYAALVTAQAQRWGSKRFLVRVTSIRKNLLDEDNLCEKYHVDCLRYAGIIPSDDPGKATIEVRQRKADPGAEEQTIIEVFEI